MLFRSQAGIIRLVPHEAGILQAKNIECEQYLENIQNVLHSLPAVSEWCSHLLAQGKERERWREREESSREYARCIAYTSSALILLQILYA